MKIESKKIRDSARGEACSMQIAGICNFNPESTVFAHLPDESNGMGKKSDDISGCFSCDSCHSAVDGRKQANWGVDAWCEFQNHKEFYMRRAMVRTWRRLIEMGVVVIK